MPARDETDGKEPDARFAFANERTFLAWSRTALAFATVGGVVLKSSVIPGLVIMAIAPVVWRLGLLPRTPGRPRTPGKQGRLGREPGAGFDSQRLITASIVLVCLVALGVAIFARHPSPR